MEIKVLSSKNYDDDNKNYGDCFIIDLGNEVVVYDCGSKEHADEVLAFIDKRNIDEVTVVLSHNDSDHFDGIPTLIANKKVKAIYTMLLYKHIDELLEEIDDGRKTRESIKRQITERYDNVASLSGCGLEEATVGVVIAPSVEVVGPSHEYLISAIAKEMDTTEGDTIDQETIVNATSIQLALDMDGRKVLLCGDCSFAAIEDKVKEYEVIQLPHHGKAKQGEKIFEAMSGKNSTVYVISDNTGSSNGGSDNLDTKGHNVKNTKVGEVLLSPASLKMNIVGSYGYLEK